MGLHPDRPGRRAALAAAAGSVSVRDHHPRRIRRRRRPARLRQAGGLSGGRGFGRYSLRPRLPGRPRVRAVARVLSLRVRAASCYFGETFRVTSLRARPVGMCAAGWGRALVPGETSAAQPGDAWVTACGQLGGLPSGPFTVGLPRHTEEAEITADVDSADLSGVTGTPTFFVKGRRHRGAYDINT